MKHVSQDEAQKKLELMAKKSKILQDKASTEEQ